MEFSLAGAAFFGVASMYAALRWEARRSNALECTRDLFDTVLTAGIVGLAVGRVASMIGAGTNPLTHLGDLLILRGGVATGWASLAALITVAILNRRDIGRRLDALSAACLIGLAGWHAGCLARAGCLGTPSDLPWAFAGTTGGVTRHPVELYAALGLIVAAVGSILWRRRAPVGAAAAGSVAGAALIRLVTEPLRPSIGGGPVGWYVAGVVVGAVGVAVAYRQRASADPSVH